MTAQDNKAKGPGQRDRGGFSFDDRKEGGRGRGDREGGRGGRGGGRDRRDGGGASYRVVNELSALEKALTKTDFTAMKEPLSAVLRALKPMRLQSLEQLDLNARGRLITSLMRVMRLPKPAATQAPAPEAAPAEAAPAEAAPAEAAPAEAAPAEAAPAEAAPAEAAPAEAAADAAPSEASAEAPAADAAPSGAPSAEAAAPAPAAPSAPAVDPRIAAWTEAQFTIGLIWRSVNANDRAQTAFDAAGRQPTEAELAVPAQAERPPREERPERGPRRERAERGDRRDRPPRGDRPERSARPERPAPFVSSGDWKADVATLESQGRTRDAGRLHEKNGSFADAARLYEAGGDLKAALRNAALGKLDEQFDRLAAKLKPEDAVEALERAQRWEKVMELHVARNDFDSIAKLYERTAQFDQAGLAWERAGKLSLARKSYERAKDYGAANRLRDLEVQKLIERGDRLGAATLLMGANKRAEAVETIKALPGPKAYHFLQKLKLNAEADAFAKEELGKAEVANNALARARWLEAMGKLQEAADVYLAAERKDKAAFVFEAMGELKKAAELFESAAQLDKAQKIFEKLGDAANVERLKAMPRPEPKARAAATPDTEGADPAVVATAADAAPNVPPAQA